MSTYGLIIRNGVDKALVIDGEQPNYRLVASGTVATDTAPGPGVDFTSKTISVPGLLAPVVAHSCTAGAYGIVYANGTVKLIAAGPVGTTIKYWVFDDPNTAPVPTGWGLVVRHPTTKKVVYVSGQKSMRVVGFPTVSKGSSLPSFPSGKTYAVATVGVAGTGTYYPWTGGGIGPWTYNEDRTVVAVNGRVLTTVTKNQSTTTGAPGSPFPANFVIDGKALVLDVSDY